MVKGTHRGSVKDGDAVQLLSRAETSRRRATAPQQQPPHGVGRQSPSLTHRRGRRQSAAAVALFLSKRGKHALREASGLPRAQRVSNTSTSRCKLGSVVLTLDELRQITNNFSDDQLLGKGAFGKVYKGVLTNGDVIAVKRFASTIPGLQDVQYKTEAQHLMRLKHPNIVQLQGYCSETEMKLVRHNGTFVRAEQPERLLCLEYMPKGSLRDHLSDETSGLEWNTRYKIIVGICYGLHYLHEWWQATPVIHMDLKPANILLDDNMVPKIADFGLSRLFGEYQTKTCTTNPKGTLGYMAPEYLEKGLVTKMFDIFSLGVIILEIITGLKDYPRDETETASQQYINHVLNNWRHRLTKAQGYTSQDIDCQQIKKCVQIGLLCVKFDRMKRPTIDQIIKMLQGSDEAYRNERELPPRPAESVKMRVHGDGDELASLPPWMIHSTQDLPKTSADPAQIPQDRRPWSTDADMTVVNADTAPQSQAASPVPVWGGGHFTQPWFGSWKSVEQGLLGEVGPLTVSDERLVVESPATEDRCRYAGGIAADETEIIVAAIERGGKEGEDQRRFRSFKSDVRSDLLAQDLSNWLLSLLFLNEISSFSLRDVEEATGWINQTKGETVESTHSGTKDAPWRIVPFTGPSDSKANKPRQQGRCNWKEMSIKGLRAVADPSSSSPQPSGQQEPQQGYVGLKKKLELEDDGNGNRWHAHEYTQLLPSDDGTNKLVPADISLRFEFQEDKPPSSSEEEEEEELSRTGTPKDDGPKTAPSTAWDDMTKLHVKVTTNMNGSQRKKPYYKVMYAICHHCDQVFNVDSKQGTNNQSNHLKGCKPATVIARSH